MPNWAIRFSKFHRENPNIAEELLQVCIHEFEKGYRRYAIRHAYAVARYLQAVPVDNRDESGFRLNENFTAYYSRLLSLMDDRLVGFFEVRKLSDGMSEEQRMRWLSTFLPAKRSQS